MILLFHTYDFHLSNHMYEKSYVWRIVCIRIVCMANRMYETKRIICMKSIRNRLYELKPNRMH